MPAGAEQNLPGAAALHTAGMLSCGRRAGGRISGASNPEEPALLLEGSEKVESPVMALCWATNWPSSVSSGRAVAFSCHLSFSTFCLVKLWGWSAGSLAVFSSLIPGF